MNSSFETGDVQKPSEGWVLQNSRAGEISVSKLFYHSGKQSLCLKKNDRDGVLSISYADPIPVKAGNSYLAAAYYHLENARYGSVFNFIVQISAPGKKDVSVRPLYTNDRVIYPMPISNTKGGWQRTFMNVNIPQDYLNAAVKIKMEVSGVPYTIYFDDVVFRVNPSPAVQYTHFISEANTRPVYSPEEVYQIMHRRDAVKVELPEIGKTPLMVNGKSVPMLAFASIHSADWPRQSAHKDYLRHGIKIHFIPVRAYSNDLKECTWLSEGKYDFSPIERKLQKMLGYDPDACILLYINDQAYPELGDKHPEARWINAFGDYSVGEKYVWKAATVRAPGEYWNLSYSAEVVRRETSDYYKALGEYLRNSELGKAVIGIHIGGGTDGQWFRRGWNLGFGSFDHSTGAEQQFRIWLKNKYRNDLAALRKAWGDRNVTFKTARLCVQQELSPEKYYLREDNPLDMRIIDSNLFGNEGNDGLCETINQYCRSFKEGIGRTSITLTYYPKKHDDLRKLINEPYLDGILGVMEYGFLRNLGQTGGNESSPGSLKLHNKLFLTEMDYRTEYAASWGEDGNHHARNVVVMKSPEALANQMRRDLGNSLCQGQGGWFYGLCGHIWGTDEYYSVMEEAAKGAEMGMKEPLYEDHGQIAVFLDEKEKAYLSSWKNAALASHIMGTYWVRVPFSRSGLSWDDYVLEDSRKSEIAPI